MLLIEIRHRITDALKNGRDTEKTILRTLLGESQRRNLTEDRQIVNLIKQLIATNNEILPLFPEHRDNRPSIHEENTILNSLLPKELSFAELESFVLNGDNTNFEQIQGARTEGQGIGIAMQIVKANQLPVDSKTVISLVKKIRSN